MDFTLTQEQYESLIALARIGAAAEDKVTQLEEWLKLIESANGVTRSIVVVKWQELGQPLPTGTSFPDVWPPQLTAKIELVTRPVARVDVENVLSAKAINPTNVLVTRDPNGLVGLQTLDNFFTN